MIGHWGETLRLWPGEYGLEELNVFEIAKVLGVTTGRVSQIKKSAVENLRAALGGLVEL